jgi:outer membrane immunogenic protein
VRRLSLALLTTAAFSQFAVAADLPVKAPVKAAPARVAAFSWTGFYIGGHGGGLWSNNSWTERCSGLISIGCVAAGGLPFNAGDPFTATLRQQSFLGGVQGGFNFQTGSWVWGIEADWSWANRQHCVAVSGAGGFAIDISDACSKVNAVGTLAGRLGFAADRALLYLKGGAAFISEDHVVLFSPRFPPVPGFPPGFFAVGSPVTDSPRDTRAGWMLGVGGEYAFSGNWSAKVEYNYMDFGTRTVRFTTLPFVPPFPGAGNSIHDVDIRERVSVVKAGINYRFGGPVN